MEEKLSVANEDINRENFSKFRLVASTALGVAVGLGTDVIIHWVVGHDKMFTWAKPEKHEIKLGAAFAAFMGSVFGIENLAEQTIEIIGSKNRKISHLERVMAEKDTLMNAARSKS